MSLWRCLLCSREHSGLFHFAAWLCWYFTSVVEDTFGRTESAEIVTVVIHLLSRRNTALLSYRWENKEQIKAILNLRCSVAVTVTGIIVTPGHPSHGSRAPSNITGTDDLAFHTPKSAVRCPKRGFEAEGCRQGGGGVIVSLSRWVCCVTAEGGWGCVRGVSCKSCSWCPLLWSVPLLGLPRGGLEHLGVLLCPDVSVGWGGCLCPSAWGTW